MSRYKTQRIAPILLAIVIIIVAIAGLVALGRLLLTGSTSSSSTSSEQQTTETLIATTQANLLKTDANRSVSLTVRGPIVADEDFRSYRITISPSSRNFDAFSGYLDKATSQQSLTNNIAAYSQFVNALDKAQLAKAEPVNKADTDLLGICATGKVYEFNLLEDGKSTALFWTSTCSGSTGNLSANVTQLSSLFYAQIPDGSNIESSLSL